MPEALVSLGVALVLLLAFVLFLALCVVGVWLELRRAPTAQEIAHELELIEDAVTDAWIGFVEARRNHPWLDEMEVR